MAEPFPGLPRSIYNTGGTILSASNYSRLDNVIYGAGRGPTPADLIGNLSEVLRVAQLAVVDFPVQGGSAVINSSMYLNVSRHANRHLCTPASDVAGAIMLHGTNTLEETVSKHNLILLLPDHLPLDFSDTSTRLYTDVGIRGQGEA